MIAADFARAQERLLERRRRGNPTIDTASSSSYQSQIDPSPENHPSLFRHLVLLGQDAWVTISGRQGTRPAFRVGQLDADLLDGELLDLLRRQAGEGLKFFGNHLRDDWSAEIQLAIKAILFKLTFWDHDTTYGAALQNLRFTDSRNTGPVHVSPSRWQKGAYGLLTVGGNYAWGKWEQWLLEQDQGPNENPTFSQARLRRATSFLGTTHSAATLLTFLLFLLNGQHHSVLGHILKIRLVPRTSQITREVSFEYLNRQLVWHAFTEFLLFILPLVGISRWRRLISRAWRKFKALSTSRSSQGGKTESQEPEIKQGELAFLPERTCAICYADQSAPIMPGSVSNVTNPSGGGGIVGSSATDITNPYASLPCRCVYCFVCIVTRLEAEEGEGWICLRCGELVTRCEPWDGDILQNASSR
ncbi:MAG: hypothetical protein M1825_006019 [Sarcosagium campestre]|nr:MAG: hypothetical protein M1825_006019 [Sarcosagium campestre]